MSDPISPETVFIRRGNLAETEVEGAIVMMSIAQGHCYALDKSAARIWQLLASPISVVGLCGALTREYAVEPENCRRDVLSFLEQLFDENLIDIAG